MSRGAIAALLIVALFIAAALTAAAVRAEGPPTLVQQDAWSGAASSGFYMDVGRGALYLGAVGVPLGMPLNDGYVQPKLMMRSMGSKAPPSIQMDSFTSAHSNAVLSFRRASWDYWEPKVLRPVPVGRRIGEIEFHGYVSDLDGDGKVSPADFGFVGQFIVEPLTTVANPHFWGVAYFQLGAQDGSAGLPLTLTGDGVDLVGYLKWNYQRVSVGSADSCGTGYRCLRVPNE